MFPDSNPVRRAFLRAAASGAVLIVLSIAFVDRPLSSWLHASFHQGRMFVGLTHIVDPIQPLAALGLIGAGIAAALGWRPGQRGRLWLAVCFATVAACLIKDDLKIAFGRTWPESWLGDNPSWIANGVFGFFPLHDGKGWLSFPSGHSTAVAAPLMVLWICVPRFRVLYVTLIGAVIIGLLGADFHWLSDIIAGFYLGLGSAVGTAALLQARAPSHASLLPLGTTGSKST